MKCPECGVGHKKKRTANKCFQSAREEYYLLLLRWVGIYCQMNDCDVDKYICAKLRYEKYEKYYEDLSA